MIQRPRASERGAILILVAIAIAVMMALAAFAIDNGVFWMARGQAQIAADAGALSGASALVMQDNTWPIPANGAAENAAKAAANLNLVNGASGATLVTSVCPPWLVAPFNTNCIQVDVFRDGTFASPTMPTYFANVFGVGSMGIKATATAQVSQANSSGCMRPWFIVDRTPNSYCVSGCSSPPYPISGYSDIGQTVQFHTNTGPSVYGQLDVGSGGNAIRSAIEGCATGMTFYIGQTDVLTKPGGTVGPERQGISSLLTWDPDGGPNGVHVEYQPAGCNVSMNCTSANIVGGCSAAGTCSCNGSAANCPYGGSQSPRLVQAAICSSTEADCNGSASGPGHITITNILSFFILGCNGVAGDCSGGGAVDIDAVIVASAGAQVAGGSVGPGNSFLTVLRLVR